MTHDKNTIKKQLKPKENREEMNEIVAVVVVVFLRMHLKINMN